MKKLSVRIQNRYHSAAEWSQINPILEPGEIGIESDTQKVKYGDGKSTWSQLGYAVAGGAVYEKTSYDALTQVSSPKGGDIGIVKTRIEKPDYEGGTYDASTPEHYSYTGYAWDEDTKKWIAFDGNYDAENVYFSQDLITTSAIGNISLSNGQATILTKGKNLKEAFEAIFVKEKDPAVTKPSVKFNTKHQDKEVGASVTPEFSVSLNPGEYEYGPATEITAETWAVSFGGITKNSDPNSDPDPFSGWFDNITITEGACCNISAIATYQAGTVPVTNLGNECLDRQIAAGSATSSKNLFTGYRPNFYGFTTVAADLDSLDSDMIRKSKDDGGLGLTNQESATDPAISATCTTSWMQFFYAVPKGRKTSLKANDSNGLPLTVNSKEVTVNHEGSAFSTYTLFYINNAAAYGATTLALTWS